MHLARDDVRLAASLAASQLLCATDGKAGVEELAGAAGISRRTWHRYFPAKEDCIRPMLREATSLTVQIIDDRLENGDEGACHAFVAAFGSVAGGLFAERTRKLLPIVFSSPALSAVLDHEAVHTAQLLRDLFSRRFSRDAGDAVVAALSTVLPALGNAALRDSLKNGAAPVDLLSRRVQALGLTQLELSVSTAERRSS